MAFRQSRPVMGNPLIPLWNDMRALQVLTRLETMQKNGGQISPLGMLLCLKVKAFVAHCPTTACSC